jgi:hypothetical protein
VVVRVELTRASGAKVSYKVGQNVTFLNLAKPAFTLQLPPNGLLTTRDNQRVNLTFNDASSLNVDDYSLKWSLSPSEANHNTTTFLLNGTMINFRLGALTRLTSYLLTVQVTHLVYP